MIILASQSPRRKKLLQQIGLGFSIQPSLTDEFYNDNEEPTKIVQMLAFRKAQDVASSNTKSLIIGADTIVVHNGKILEKPNSEEEATGMLKTLSGQKHQVLTGVSLIKTDKEGNIQDSVTFSEITKVYFGNLSEAEIGHYVSSGSPMDKAGGYGIQDDWGALFVERIEGDYNNVIGLPLFAFYQHMKTFAPEYLHQLQN